MAKQRPTRTGNSKPSSSEVAQAHEEIERALLFAENAMEPFGTPCSASSTATEWSAEEEARSPLSLRRSKRNKKKKKPYRPGQKTNTQVAPLLLKRRKTRKAQRTRKMKSETQDRKWGIDQTLRTRGTGGNEETLVVWSPVAGSPKAIDRILLEYPEGKRSWSTQKQAYLVTWPAVWIRSSSVENITTP